MKNLYFLILITLMLISNTHASSEEVGREELPRRVSSSRVVPVQTSPMYSEVSSVKSKKSKKSKELKNNKSVFSMGNMNDSDSSLERKSNLLSTANQHLDRYTNIQYRLHCGTSINKLSNIEYNKKEKKVTQIVEKNSFEKISDGVVVQFTTTILLSCNILFKPIGWKHNDQDLKSYKLLAVFGVRNGEERLVQNTLEISEEYVPYNILSTFFEASGDFVEENGIPQKQSGRLCKIYIRPDKTEHRVKGDISTFHLEKKHVQFFHDESKGGSYQIVNLVIQHEGREYLVRKEYQMRNFQYEHMLRLIKWEDDKIKHYSTKFEDVFINIEPQTQDKNSVPNEHLLVRRGKTTIVPHQKLWIGVSWMLPGNNYKIQHNGYEYR